MNRHVSAKLTKAFVDRGCRESLKSSVFLVALFDVPFGTFLAPFLRSLSSTLLFVGSRYRKVAISSKTSSGR